MLLTSRPTDRPLLMNVAGSSPKNKVLHAAAITLTAVPIALAESLTAPPVWLVAPAPPTRVVSGRP